MTRTIDYVATIPHVREVSILGTADLAFWTGRLRTEGLTPLDWDGRAQILVIAADLRFRGIQFQEISFSIVLSEGGAFLAQAFNSKWLFAFFERNFFRTPYDFGSVRVSTALPASAQLNREEVLFRAVMGTGAAPTEPGFSPYPEGWDGPVFLPSRSRDKRRVFFAQIRGATQTVVFEPSRDLLEIRPSKEISVFQALIDSGFNASHWLVRQDAVHAKSKTYPRSD